MDNKEVLARALGQEVDRALKKRHSRLRRGADVLTMMDGQVPMVRVCGVTHSPPIFGLQTKVPVATFSVDTAAAALAKVENEVRDFVVIGWKCHKGKSWDEQIGELHVYAAPCELTYDVAEHQVIVSVKLAVMLAQGKDVVWIEYVKGQPTVAWPQEKKNEVQVEDVRTVAESVGQ